MKHFGRHRGNENDEEKTNRTDRHEETLRDTK